MNKCIVCNVKFKTNNPNTKCCGMKCIQVYFTPAFKIKLQLLNNLKEVKEEKLKPEIKTIRSNPVWNQLLTKRLIHYKLNTKLSSEEIGIKLNMSKQTIISKVNNLRTNLILPRILFKVIE